MAHSDAEFAWSYPCGDATVFIECDRRTCYAYLARQPGVFGGDTWLFNLIDAPQVFESTRDRAPLNPAPCSRPFDLAPEVRPEAFSIEKRGDKYEIFYGGTRIGLIWIGAKRGYSAFATAASPVASPFPAE